MRSWIVPVGFCLFLFFIPLQCFVMGGSLGAGIQGAVYRYQITTSGESIIPVTTEFTYVTGGRITGKSVYSILSWTLGTLVLAILAALSLIFRDTIQERQLLLLLRGAAVAGFLYIIALSIQYGFLLNGPAGVSYPLGIVFLFISLIVAYYYRHWLLGEDTPTGTIS